MRILLGTKPPAIEREVYIKDEEPTDPRYGKPPDKRGVEELLQAGIINLDKPAGPTSHDVVAWIKKMFNLKKAGHGGTLEPL